MGAKGITIAEELHVTNALAPVNLNDAAKNTAPVSLKDHAHVTFIVQLGVTGAASTLTVEECDNITPSNSTAIAFSYYAETTAGGDTLGARTAATNAGFATSTNDVVFYLIEIDASQLTDGYPYVRVRLTDPGADTFGSVVAILSGARYAQDQSATVIT